MIADRPTDSNTVAAQMTGSRTTRAAARGTDRRRRRASSPAWSRPCSAPTSERCRGPASNGCRRARCRTPSRQPSPAAGARCADRGGHPRDRDQRQRLHRCSASRRCSRSTPARPSAAAASSARRRHRRSTEVAQTSGSRASYPRSSEKLISPGSAGKRPGRVQLARHRTRRCSNSATRSARGSPPSAGIKLEWPPYKIGDRALGVVPPARPATAGRCGFRSPRSGERRRSRRRRSPARSPPAAGKATVDTHGRADQALAADQRRGRRRKR